jgi:diguanylate cyclase (GGDEF)-like protein
VRVFNACEIVAAGAAARMVLSLLWHPAVVEQFGSTWLSPWPFVALLGSGLAWKATDMLLTHVCLSLAIGTPIRRFGLNRAQLYNECALLFAAVPLALSWSIDVWLALFVFASIAGGSMLVHFSEIQHRLKIDVMTGVMNSSTFHGRFQSTLGEGDRLHGSVALLIVDIDNFKAVNDSFGHDFGDQTLSWFADILKGAARTDDLLGRIGGEEFALLARNTTRAEAFATAERLREAIASAPYATPDGAPITLTASIGVALFPDDGALPREVFHAADVALYAAKHGGRNLVRMATLRSPEHVGS